MLNATFNNISGVSWRSVLMVEETAVLGENHRPAASYWQTERRLYDTGTCFIQNIYAPSSSLLQGKHLPFPLPHFASICFAYLWSFRWPNDIVTLPRYFSLRLPHLNIPTDPLLLPTNWTRISANVACFIFKSLKRIQPLPVCPGFFICIRNSLDRPCITIPSWSSPLKCKVSL